MANQTDTVHLFERTVPGAEQAAKVKKPGVKQVTLRVTEPENDPWDSGVESQIMALRIGEFVRAAGPCKVELSASVEAKVKAWLPPHVEYTAMQEPASVDLV